MLRLLSLPLSEEQYQLVGTYGTLISSLSFSHTQHHAPIR